MDIYAKARQPLNGRNHEHGIRPPVGLDDSIISKYHDGKFHPSTMVMELEFNTYNICSNWIYWLNYALFFVVLFDNVCDFVQMGTPTER